MAERAATADPRKISAFMFQYNCFPRGLSGDRSVAPAQKPIKAHKANGPVIPKEIAKAADVGAAPRKRDA